MEHVQGLWEAGSDPEIWKFTSVEVHSVEQMKAYIEAALTEQSRGGSLPFATIDAGSGQVVGSTRFGSIAREHRRVEIGWTFVSPRWQRTAINTEAKYLMLRHAFEVWQCNRVELKTGSTNVKSRAAILRIGAKEEGTLRQHMINSTGFIRDTVYYSVIRGEWPEVKAGLERKLLRA
jgi:RimJ/RimL family protein N-acetyltransferase